MANEVDTIHQVGYDFNFNSHDFWLKYEEYLLKNVNRRAALDRINYAKKFSHILINGNAQGILSIPNKKGFM